MDRENPINALENTLRDLVEDVLRRRHGEGWAEHLGVTDARKTTWEQRRDEERKKRTAGMIDERLLYYADFTDLFTIIKKNWDPEFAECFGDQTELRVYMDKLRDLRNPEAHSRSLLEVEEQLVLGMCGELRQKITIFLSSGKGGPEPEHFARIEQVVDSYGNRVTGEASGLGFHRPGLIMRPGDRLVFRGHGWDPKGSPLTWRLYFAAASQFQSLQGPEFEFAWTVSDADIGENSYVSFGLISERPYVRLSQHGADDTATLFYTVLPR